MTYAAYTPDPGLYWHDTSTPDPFRAHEGDGTMGRDPYDGPAWVDLCMSHDHKCLCDECEAFADTHPQLTGRWQWVREATALLNEHAARLMDRGIHWRDAYAEAMDDLKHLWA